MGRYEDWPEGSPAVEAEMAAQSQAKRPGGAKRLLDEWRRVMDPFASVHATRITVDPKLFNTWRRRKLDTGLTDAQLVQSFELFAQAIKRGQVSIRGREAFKIFMASHHKYAVGAPKRAETRRHSRY